MDTPQEVEVWLILPALRKQFVIFFKKIGLRQKEIAESMDLTEAAISQYMSGKRGGGLRFPDPVLKEVESSCRKIAGNKSSFQTELQRCLKVVKKTKFICGICNKSISVPPDCEICFR